MNFFRKHLPNFETKENRATVAMLVNSFKSEYPAKDYLRLLRDGYERNPVGRFCVDKISTSVGQVPMKVQQLVDGEYVDTIDKSGKELQKLLNRPSLYQTGREFKEQIMRHHLIAGTAFLSRMDPDQPLASGAQRVNSAIPTELYTLPPHLVTQNFSQGGLSSYWFSAPFGRVTFYNNVLATNPAELSMVAEFRVGSPLNDLTGLSPLASAVADIDILNEGKLHNLSFLKNGMRAGGILSFLKTLSGKSKNSIKRQLSENHTGSINAGRPLVIEGEEVKWTETSVNSKDADYILLSESSAKALCLSIGVPTIFLGIKGDSTYANVEEANKAFWLDTVSYYSNGLAEQLTDWLCPLYGRPDVYKVVPDYTTIPAMQAAKTQQSKEVDGFSFLTINEKRDVFGVGPIEGGDKLSEPKEPKEEPEEVKKKE